MDRLRRRHGSRPSRQQQRGTTTVQYVDHPTDTIVDNPADESANPPATDAWVREPSAASGLIDPRRLFARIPRLQPFIAQTLRAALARHLPQSVDEVSAETSEEVQASAAEPLDLYCMLLLLCEFCAPAYRTTVLPSCRPAVLPPGLACPNVQRSN